MGFDVYGVNPQETVEKPEILDKDWTKLGKKQTDKYFEAIKLNYGESRTVNPNRDIEEQRRELIKDCYTIIGNEAKAWEGIKTIQKVTSSKKIIPVKK